MVLFTASVSFPRLLHLLFQPPPRSYESRTGWHCLVRGWKPTGALLLRKQPLFELTPLAGHCRNNSSLLCPKIGWRAVITASRPFPLFLGVHFSLFLTVKDSVFVQVERDCASGPRPLWGLDIVHVRPKEDFITLWWTTSRHPQAHQLLHPPFCGPCAPSLVSGWALKLNSPISHPLRSDSCSTRKGPSTAIHLVSRLKGAVYLPLADLGLRFKTNL